MKWDVLLTLRDQLAADPALIEFVQARYQRAATFVIGFPRPQSADAYPYISLVPISERRDEQTRRRLLRVSVACGVNQPAIDADGAHQVFRGIAEAAQLAELIAAGLVERPALATGVWLEGDFESFGDFGRDHPMYWVESVFNLQVRE